MDFKPIDGYLLDGTPSKQAAIEHLLRDRIADPRALPFYRAFEAVGGRAADEAIVAVRALAAGRATDDATIQRLRSLVAVTRAASAGDRAAVTAAIERSGGTLEDVRGLDADLHALADAARSAYALALA